MAVVAELAITSAGIGLGATGEIALDSAEMAKEPTEARSLGRVAVRILWTLAILDGRLGGPCVLRLRSASRTIENCTHHCGRRRTKNCDGGPQVRFRGCVCPTGSRAAKGMRVGQITEDNTGRLRSA